MDRTPRRTIRPDRPAELVEVLLLDVDGATASVDLRWGPDTAFAAATEHPVATAFHGRRSDLRLQTETSPMASVTLLIVFPFLMAYAAARDLLTMTIPNAVSLLLLLGFAAFAGATGMWGWDLLSHLGAGAATLVVTFTLFALGKIGGGDAKLAAATAVWIGFDQLAQYLVVASLAGGALSLAILVARAHPLPSLLGRLPFAIHLHDAKTGVPYGIALCLGALIVIPETVTWARMMAS